MKPITFPDFSRPDFPSFLKMALELWPDYEEEELEKLLQTTVEEQKYRVIMARREDGTHIGFAMFSIRTDYVEGAKQSPTGYLEGIFVAPEHRNQGIARELLRIGEGWCKEKGCTQMGSDTWLTNTASREFHQKIGFWEEEETVHFLKDIE